MELKAANCLSNRTPRTMPQQNPPKSAKLNALVVSKADYVGLAALREGRESMQRVHKKDPAGQAMRTAGELYEKREFVAAYEHFKPAYDKVVSDMQRVLARNIEFESNKVAKEQRKPLAAAKLQVLSMKADAQKVIDQCERLLQDLENKPLVRHYLKKRASESGSMEPSTEAAETAVATASDTRVDADVLLPREVVVGTRRYKKVAFASPEENSVYCVRDKAKGERVIRVVRVNPNDTVQVVVLRDGASSNQPIELTVESLAKQAAKGWCSLLVPVNEDEAAHVPNPRGAEPATTNVLMRLDIQNFSRCCADIVRANIKFDTQLIKDIGEGPFRAGSYEQAFLTFEQIALGFTSAVTNSRQAIAEGRRALNDQKGKLSGKEILERTAAFTRSEQLINTAQREFSTILEGLRMHLRAYQDSSRAESAGAR